MKFRPLMLVTLLFLVSCSFQLNFNTAYKVFASEENKAALGAEKNPAAADSTAEIKTVSNTSTVEAAVSAKQFSLYEFGAGKCVQCKNMKPIIEELQKELKGKVEVKFFDVQADAEITEKFKVMLIPCQVFLDGEGKEVFRHEGFFSKEEILAKLKESGAKL